MKLFFKKALGEVNKNSLFALLILAVSVFGCFTALRFTAANLAYQLINNDIQIWNVNGRILMAQDFEQSKETVQTILAIHSSNPFYLDLSGQVNEWGALSSFKVNESLQQAKLAYIQATKIRPLWPVTWANLAMVKWRLQEFDDEMLFYLLKANALGSQSKEVHILFSRLGLSLYGANNSFYTQIKDIVHQRLAMGIQHSYSRDEILQFVDKNHALPTVCRWLRFDMASVEKHLLCSK